ncbi:MAG: NADH-quinone oxidoreductase subunit H [Desulfovibrio sp.]|jgi:formate hydrogenlyase subunit 4|nr:NADH-quinone oxidoreductase subunit H [Desulfovibrio sp.]
MTAPLAPLAPLVGCVLSLLFAPLLPGIINRVKAWVGGRQGRPLLQLYYDLFKLLKKSAVYSRHSGWMFRLAPVAGLAAALMALAVLPFGALGSLVSFPGDFIFLAGLFALARFTLILAALDTGSAFEGMGAAREAMFSALGEPIFLFCLMILGYRSGMYSLALMLGDIKPVVWTADWPFFLMLAFAFFLILLLENCRIPADDPNTHLELTMIHEVMILDHSGPDLALLEYASALKLWIFSLIIAGVLLPGPGESLPVAGHAALTLLIVFTVAALVGLVESVIARFRMERVPQILSLAGSFVCLAALSLWS